MEELVNANASLATTNSGLSASVASLLKANTQLFHQIGNRRNNKKHTREDTPAPCPKNMVPPLQDHIHACPL